MNSQAEAGVEQLADDLVDVRQKFAELALRDGALSEGFRSIAEGLGLVLDELEGDADGQEARLEVVVRGLQTLADVMSERGDAAPAEAPAPANPAAQFREMFRKEARKRLSGLSISMMGIFSERASADALSQTAAHLHAMKGAATMVGLNTIGDLVRAMEQVVLDMQEQQPAERSLPTRALLRGFRLIEKSVADPELGIDEAQAGQVVQTLHAYRDAAPGEGDAIDPQAARTAEEFRKTRRTQPMAAMPKQPRPDPLAGYDGPLEKRLLIVDDVDAIAASVGFVLSELDVPIDMAENGEEALEKLRARPYSLVVSDVDMPRMNGMALTRVIRNDERMSEIPVILLTSLDRPDERDAGIEAGATDYIIKGAIGGGELLERVRELLAMAPDVPAGDFPPSPEQLRVLIAEDVETIAASIAFVLSDGPFDIEIARNGAQALARLREASYDVVLSDVQMPEMGGFELLAAVRGDDDLADLPVILLTSLQDPEVQARALDAGASRFLIKGEVAGQRLRQILEEVASTQDET